MEIVNWMVRIEHKKVRNKEQEQEQKTAGNSS